MCASSIKRVEGGGSNGEYAMKRGLAPRNNLTVIFEAWREDQKMSREQERAA